MCVNIFENTDQFLKIQTKYRPIFDNFLKRSVLQTKIIFTDHCVITDQQNNQYDFLQVISEFYKAISQPIFKTL